MVFTTLQDFNGFGANSASPPAGLTDVTGSIFSVSGGNLVQATDIAAIRFCRNATTRQDQISELTIVSYVSGTYPGVSVRISDTSVTNCYVANVDPAGGLAIQKKVGSTYTGLTTNTGMTITVGKSYKIALQAVGVSPTVLTATLTNITDGGAPITATISDSTSQMQGVGYYAINNYNNTSPESYSRFTTYEQTGSTLSAGTASLSSRTVSGGNAVANLTTTAPSGGTSPYTYQWQVSTTSGSAGFSNIAGATTATIAYSTATPGQYWFRCNYGDAASGTSVSNVITTILSTEQIYVMAIGDSITYGAFSSGRLTNPPPSVAVTLLESMFGYRMAEVNNQGVSSKTTADWISTGSLLTPAIASGNSGASALGITKKYCFIMLGTNDAWSGNSSGAVLTKAQFKANLQNMITALQASGWKPVLNYPIYTGAGNRDLTMLGTQYPTAINELVNGTSVLQGDVFGYQYYLANSDELTDINLHPSQTGANNLGNLWATGLWKSVYSTKPSVSNARRHIRS